MFRVRFEQFPGRFRDDGFCKVDEAMLLRRCGWPNETGCEENDGGFLRKRFERERFRGKLKQYVSTGANPRQVCRDFPDQSLAIAESLPAGGWPIGAVFLLSHPGHRFHLDSNPFCSTTQSSRERVRRIHHTFRYTVAAGSISS